MPHIGAKAGQHHSPDRRALRSILVNQGRHLCANARTARALVACHWHMADLHHKIRRDRGQQFGLALPQAQGHAMGAVGVDDATGRGIMGAGGLVNLAVQGQGFAGPLTADLHALQINLGQLGWLKQAQAGVGWRDQEGVFQANTDVARRGMHIAALKQAAANLANRHTGLGLVHASTAKALVKKSTAPKLPDFSARCKSPPAAWGAA